jgi:hypothetical protein
MPSTSTGYDTRHGAVGCVVKVTRQWTKFDWLRFLAMRKIAHESAPIRKRIGYGMVTLTQIQRFLALPPDRRAGKWGLLKLEDGREFAGKMFIDASYEGDLLPGAGVTFTVGREANATYGETVSGIQVGNATKNQLVNNINPYVVPGDPASGLLPGVEPDAGGADGTADHRLQAYCFRMVLTDIPANRVTIAQPEGYDEADYELLFRSIEAGQTAGFFKLDLMPNRKTDSNNTGGISTDYIGMNYGPGWDWSTLGHDDRAALAKKHENWQRGIVWTLQNHPRVPQTIRNGLAKWGLPADEFADNNNWPYELYVREARRMVSDYVMHQQHCSGVLAATDSIGLAAYTMDSHNVQRHVRNGMVKNEGDVQLSVPNPYPISYRSIIPKRGECTNLLVPWSLSASHMAFGSIRMEPVFMILAQSAAIAATMSIDGEIDVQDLAYPALRAALVAAGQELGDPVAAPPAVVIDNDHPSLVTFTGEWLAAAAAPGFAGADYHHNNNAGQGEKEVVYRFPPGTKGVHRVYLRWTSHANRATNIPVDIRHAEGVATVTVNQRENGAQWNALGIHRFDGGADEGLVIRTNAANGFVIADAVGLSPVGPDDDTDGDGLSDLRELLLGLDPLVSNSAFIEALKEHPQFFGLHHPDEIHDLVIGRPVIAPAADAGLDLNFQLRATSAGAGWQEFGTIALALDPAAHRKFFRVSLPSP